jgi:hypothetical protein
MRVLAAVIAVAALSPASAWPCGNPIFLSGEKSIRLVRDAERALNAGNNELAAKLSSPWRHELSEEHLQSRVELVHAVALLRIQVKRRATERAKLVRWEQSRMSIADRDKLAAALRQPYDDLADLESLHTGNPDSPVFQARLAEALLVGDNPENTKRASDLMEDLATRDLVPDAFAWVTLATTRRIAGDAQGSDAALTRCKRIAWTKKLCQLAG